MGHIPKPVKAICHNCYYYDQSTGCFEDDYDKDPKNTGKCTVGQLKRVVRVGGWESCGQFSVGCTTNTTGP